MKTIGHGTALVLLGLALGACGGGDGGSSSSPPSPPSATRSFLMGTTPFFATSSTFADWRFENLEDKDLLSVHVDDFWGVPWIEFRDGQARPGAWESKWITLTNNVRASGKVLYLAVSPLGDRKTLAPRVKPDGTTEANWAPVDANGCYRFATDPGASGFKTAYIQYLSYLINLVQPTYVSPAIEMNIQFNRCTGADKAAWIAWYRDVHNALKAAFPALIIFPTFQMEHMYGIADAQAACAGGLGVAPCFDQRLNEALTIPGDRMAFSTYPVGWKFRSEYSFSYPTDTYSRVKSATSRKIWISETGWPAVRILTSYKHGTSGSCGADLIPASMANDTEMNNYLNWLLGEALNQNFEAVVWWLNRDYLDGATAATCPCSGVNDTCSMTDLFYSVSAATELSLRVFGNMALRNYDGSPRPAHAAWQAFLSRELRLVP